MDLSKGIGWSAVVVVMSLALVAGLAAPAAGEVTFPLLVCEANGAVAVVPGPPGPAANTWSITAKGLCQGDNTGTHFADISGTGTSATLGLCDETGVVMHLEIAVTITLTSFSTGLTRVLTEMWSAPLTTFPVATPYLITDGGLVSDADFVGGGTILTRIGGMCPPLGNPAAKIAWSRILAGA